MLLYILLSSPLVAQSSAIQQSESNPNLSSTHPPIPSLSFEFVRVAHQQLPVRPLSHRHTDTHKYNTTRHTRPSPCSSSPPYPGELGRCPQPTITFCSGPRLQAIATWHPSHHLIHSSASVGSTIADSSHTARDKPDPVSPHHCVPAAVPLSWVETRVLGPLLLILSGKARRARQISRTPASTGHQSKPLQALAASHFLVISQRSACEIKLSGPGEGSRECAGLAAY